MRRKKMSVASVCKTIPVLGAASFLPFMCTDLHEQVQKWLTLDFNLGAFKFAFIKQDKIKLICVTSSQISNCNKKKYDTWFRFSQENITKPSGSRDFSLVSVSFGIKLSNLSVFIKDTENVYLNIKNISRLAGTSICTTCFITDVTMMNLRGWDYFPWYHCSKLMLEKNYPEGKKWWDADAWSWCINVVGVFNQA